MLTVEGKNDQMYGLGIALKPLRYPDSADLLN